MNKYKSTVVIEDKEGKEVCRQGDKVTITDSVGTIITGVIDSVDYDDGDKVILFEGWNTKVLLEYISSIEKILN